MEIAICRVTLKQFNNKMDSNICESVFFNSQVEEILNDNDMIQICDEVEKCELLSSCFDEEFACASVENHNM